jgi:hypothetical protein
MYWLDSFLITQGFLVGSLNDRQKSFLLNKGYSGALPEAWYAYLKSLGLTGTLTDMMVVAPSVGGDVTPPVVSGVDFSAGNAIATVNEAGTAEYLMSTSSVPIANGAAWTAAFTAAVVKGSFAVSIGSNNTSVNTTSLTPGSYYLHVIAQDASGNRNSPSVVSATPYVVSSGPVLRASSSIGARSVQTQVINKPTGTVDGDLMLLKLAVRVGVTPVTPAGWTFVASEIRAAASNSGIYLYKKTAASEPSTYTLDVGSVSFFSAEITSYSGSSGVIATSSTFSNSSASLAGPSLTALTGSLIENFAAFDQDTLTPPASTTVLQTVTSATALIGCCAVIEGPVSAGATTARTFTSAAGSSWAVMAIEVR